MTASLALLGVCLAASTWTARAVPPMPHTPYGQLWLAGAPAADGTQIQAVIGGSAFATTYVFTHSGLPGLYRLDVPGDDPGTPGKEGGLPGETISFAVAGYEIGQTATWTEGTVQGLDLDNAPFAYAPVTQYIGGSADITFPARDGGPGLIVNAQGLNLGLTTVDITANQDCTAWVGSTVRRCFGIPPTFQTGRNATLTFYFYSSQVPAGHTCAGVEAYHQDGSDWALLTRDPSYGLEGRDCSSARHSIQVQNVADFSAFVLSAQGPPTAVTVGAFAVEAQGRAVVLIWETATEVNLLGFDLYRADTPDRPQTRLNAALIPGQTPGSPVGAAYQFRDEAVEPGVTYWYWLADVDIHGATTLHGPVSAQALPGSQYRICLPLVSK